MYLMQAASSVDGVLYTWTAADKDFDATGYPGDGTATDVVVAGDEASGGGGGGTPGGAATEVQYRSGASTFGGISKTSTDGTKLTVQGLYFEIADETDTTKKARFDASAIPAGTTRDYTLPSTTDELVGKAATQTLTNKTISLSSNTLGGTLQGALLRVNGSSVFTELALGTAKQHLRVNAGATDIEWASYGTNVDTFLTTPSSANLAAAVTDETGTGALVFADTPTLVTPNIGAATGTSLETTGGVTVANNASLGGRTSGGTLVNLVKIQATDEIILGNADRDIILEGGTSKYVEARADTFRVTNGTGGTTRALLAAGATDHADFGATPATTGFVRLDGSSSASLVTYRAGGTDYKVVDLTAGARLFFGDTASGIDTRVQGASVSIYGASSGINFYDPGGGIAAQVVSTWAFGLPRIGFSAPYASDGTVSHTFSSDANYTVTSAQYSYARIVYETGSWTAGHTVTYPSVAADTKGYFFEVVNNTAYTMTIAEAGAGTTRTLASGFGQRFWVDTAGVKYAGSAYAI